MSEIYETILPNYRFKKGKFFFKPKYSKKMTVGNKVIYINEYPIDNIHINGIIDSYKNNIVKYTIYEEEHQYGVKCTITSNNILYSIDISNYISDIEHMLANYPLPIRHINNHDDNEIDQFYENNNENNNSYEDDNDNNNEDNDIFNNNDYEEINNDNFLYNKKYYENS